MKGQLEQIIREKIAAAVETSPPALTRRKATLPPIKGKAIAVIGMRRAGKTSFLHQCRADLIDAGRSANRLLYFNFEDERLGGLSKEDLHIIPDTHLRMFPEPADEPITLFLDEIQLVSGWETFVRRLLDTPGYCRKGQVIYKEATCSTLRLPLLLGICFWREAPGAAVGPESHVDSPRCRGGWSSDPS